MDCSTSGFPVHHQLPELAQAHVIQPSHPLSSSSPPTFNLSQHQGSFPVSQFFVSGGQSIGVSASASVLPMNIQDWFPLGWTGWVSLLSKGLSRVFSNTTAQKHEFSVLSFLSSPTLTSRETIALTRRTFVGKVMSPLFNKPSRLGITFLPSSKHLLISWLSQVWRASLRGWLSNTKPRKQRGWNLPCMALEALEFQFQVLKAQLFKIQLLLLI